LNFVETLFETLFLFVEFFVLDGVVLDVKVEITQVGFGSDPDPPPHFLEVEFTDLPHHEMDIAHVLLEFHFGFLFGVEFIELVEVVASHTDQGLFGPGEEPVDGTLVEQGGELSSPFSELLAYRGEAQHDVQVVPQPVHQVLVQFTTGRVY
jgi:hypothetical protein